MTPRSSARRRVIVVSFLEPWSLAPGAGAPSLLETLKGYAAAGWEVDYLTCHKRFVTGASHETSIAVDIPGVRVVRFELPAPPLGLSGRLAAKWNRAVSFPAVAARELLRLVQGGPMPQLLYAYEVAGVLAASRVRVDVPVPVLHRFQGTILGERYANPITALKYHETTLALTMPADMYVMTDDGTQGDRALRFWNRFASPESTFFARNGVDPAMGTSSAIPETVRAQFGLPQDAPLALMVGRIQPWKRVERGVELVAALKRQQRTVHVAVAGDGEHRAAVEQLAAALGVSAQVHFLGAQPRATVADLMVTADMFWSFYDVSNCGNPLFEALLNGQAIVTISNGDTPRVIEHGANGLLTDPQDAAGRVAAVLSLTSDVEFRRRLKAGARAWANQNLLSWERRMAAECQFVDDRLGARRRESSVR